MKRKIALLLAIVMTLGLLPMSTFAASISPSKTIGVVPQYSVLYEDGWARKYKSEPATGSVYYNELKDKGVQSAHLNVDMGDLNYHVDGTDLVIKIDTNITTGQAVKLEFVNNSARWFFRNSTSAKQTHYDFRYDFIKKLGTAMNGIVGTVNNTVGESKVKDTFAAMAGLTAASSLPSSTANYSWTTTKKSNNNETIARTPLRLTYDPDYGYYDDNTKTYIRYGINGYSWFDANGVYVGTGSSRTGGTTATNANAVLDTDTYSVGSVTPKGNNELMYALHVESDRIATLHILESTAHNGTRNGASIDSTNPQAEIRIPMVARIDASSDVRISFSSSISGITNTSYLLSQVSGTSTSVTLADARTARNQFHLNTVTIKENRLGSIKTNHGTNQYTGMHSDVSTIQFIAPSGFYWNDPYSTAINNTSATVGLEYGLRWGENLTVGSTSYNSGRTGDGVKGYWVLRDGRSGQYIVTDIAQDSTYNPSAVPPASPNLDKSADYAFSYKANYAYYTAGLGSSWNQVQTGNWNTSSVSGSNAYSLDYDKAVLELHLKNIQMSTDVLGALYVKNLWLYAEENAAMGDFNITIDNADSSRPVVSQMTLKAGSRGDYGVSLTSTDPKPQLITGRYNRDDQVNSALGMLNATDKDHKTSRITIQENVQSSWWAERETQLKLSAGAKFRKVLVVDVKELGSVSGTLPTKDAIIKDGNKTNLDNSNQALPKGVFINDGERYDKIRVDGDTLYLYDLRVATKAGDTHQRASVIFDAWISLESGITGDVTLTAGGTAISQDEVPTCVIAKAIDPITVETKVTDLKIGYQYTSTADIEIKETVAGALEKGKELRLTVTDLASVDMLFNPGTLVDRTDGDIVVGNVSTFYSGQASRWDGTSLFANGQNNVGGTIAFTVDRASSKPSTIKVSNVSVKVDRTIPETNATVYKLIVWGTAVAENYGKNRDEFTTPGIMVDYAKVVSAASDRPGILQNEVRVTIGEAYYMSNGKSIDMPAAAYVSPASNSTMVPIRFVSNALGISDSAIIWDDTTKTVTILDNNRVVSFTNNDSQVRINSMPSTMLSPDGLLVTPEIREDRMYIPFRALGEAFGIPVTWDATTNTAIYNEGANVGAAAATAGN